MSLDVDGDGGIQTHELENLLRSVKVRLRMTERDIKKICSDMDKDGDGTIDVQEFLQKIGDGKKINVIQKALIQRSTARKLFEKYDSDGSGYINREEFTKVVEERFKANIDSKKIDLMLKEADRNNDGQIEFEEFAKAFAYSPAAL